MTHAKLLIATGRELPEGPACRTHLRFLGHDYGFDGRRATGGTHLRANGHYLCDECGLVFEVHTIGRILGKTECPSVILDRAYPLDSACLPRRKAR